MKNKVSSKQFDGSGILLCSQMKKRKKHTHVLDSMHLTWVIISNVTNEPKTISIMVFNISLFWKPSFAT